MPRYKLSPEERAAEKERKENLRNIMKGLDVKNFDDLKDVFKMMVGEMLENGLDGELVDELGYTKYDYRNKEGENSRNGYSKKTLKTSFGETEIKVPRDRDGEFEPQLVKKNQTTLTGDIEEKIISMYAKGMTTSDIEAHIKDIYGLECSDTTISRITDKILPVVREWQSRPLEEIYAVVFMDAIHFHVRSEGQIIKKAVYIAIGINMDGQKEVLGMWVGENESAKFWLSVLNSIKARGVEDILIACIDGLTGFTNAIEAVYPKTEIQQCIIHQIRNTTRFVSYKDIKALMQVLSEEYELQQRAKAFYGEHYTRIFENEKRELNTDGNGREVHMVCVRENGEFIAPRSMQHTSSVIQHKLGFSDFDMHSLRVTHATMLIENGAPVKYVQERLGHKKLEVTMQIYTKLSPLMIEQGRNILSSIF